MLTAKEIQQRKDASAALTIALDEYVALHRFSIRTYPNLASTFIAGWDAGRAWQAEMDKRLRPTLDPQEEQQE